MAQVQRCTGRATRVVSAPRFPGGEVIAVFYHDTCVARREGKIVKLNSGGYRTATTKLRMNQFANQFCDGSFRVYQKKGDWFIRFTDTDYEDASFYDGMEFEV